MKKKSTLLLAATLLSIGLFNKVNAADLCVAEAGAGGCYSTITDAINAASNGDRILIYSSSSPFSENITISKSLQLLCATEGGQWMLNGNITITPSAGRNVTIIGMKNQNGTITTTGSAPAGARCNVNIMGCYIGVGNINFNYDNFNLNVVSDTLDNGNIAIRYGRVIGNKVTCTANGVIAIDIETDGTATNDTINVVGNKVKCTYYNEYGIYIGTANHFFNITNNFINNTYGAPSYGIYIYQAKNSGLGKNVILNNTVNFSNSGSYGIFLYSYVPASAYINIQNNVIISSSLSYGFYYGTTAPVTFSYNYLSSGAASLYNFTSDGTNNLSSNTTVDANGILNSGSDAINGGNPDSSYYDINLTRNDAGAYGGSFTLNNFFPTSGSNANRVYYMVAPRRITVGSTLNIKADAFDR